MTVISQQSRFSSFERIQESDYYWISRQLETTQVKDDQN